MTNSDNDLDDLISIWKSGDVPEPSNFKETIKLARVKMIASLVVETIVSVLGVIAGVYLYFQDSIVLGVGVLTFSTLLFCLTLWAKSGAWHIATGSVKAELLISIKQTRAHYKSAWAGIWACALALILMAVMVYIQGADETLKLPDLHNFLIRLSVALVFLAAFLIATSFVLENTRRRLAQLTHFYDQLDDSKL